MRSSSVVEMKMVLAAQRGDRDARERIVEIHRPAIQAHMRRMLRSSEDVEDAVQETFVKAFRALHRFDPNRPLGPWLMRIATNCGVDLIRNRRQDPEDLSRVEYQVADPSVQVEAETEQSLLVDLIGEAMAALPLQHRQAMQLRHIHHMAVEEIAALLNKPEGTVKSWLFRARAQLKKQLQPTLA
ncbi:MAG: RNA polymerase sigma factor [Fimbriimonadaceae bacterium]|nr:RNA polymerase sigma factor [Fimbriimonadaceae bacterium]